jgi:mRNA interferase RelE/StbE
LHGAPQRRSSGCRSDRVPSGYEIEIAPTGYKSIKAVKNKGLRREIVKVIDERAHAPEEQGKSLMGPLEGVRSLRAARDRFRILYRVDTGSSLVSILLVGERAPGHERDVYALARKLVATFMDR